MGTYSIRYPSVDFPYGDCAIDWDFIIKNQWARSERQGVGCAWIPEKELDEEAYKKLLEHFELEQWADEFPPDRVILMSPRKLADERRKKEETFRLPRIKMINNTLGDYTPAERYGSEITIKFEKSRWTQHMANLGAIHPDPMITVPEIGELNPYSGNAAIFESAILRRESLASSYAHWESEHAHLRPAIRAEVSNNMPSEGWERNGLLLIWVEERGEWVVITYREWAEGGGMTDRSYSGPFAPNNDCLLLILKAYHEQLHRIVGTGTVRTMSPDKLTAELFTLLHFLNKDDAKALVEKLRALNWQPPSVRVELLCLLALNDVDTLMARLAELNENIQECTSPDHRSFQNDWAEDLACGRGPWWPDWAVDRALTILRQQNCYVGWYVGP